MHVFFTPLLLVLIQKTLGQVTSTKEVANCACGFYDPTSEQVFTDSSIVYFNETNGFPDDQFVIQTYEHKYDLGWNTLYREGASMENVVIGNDTTARNLTTLQMYCDPSKDDHLVVGSSIRTARQDIFFGSFRASMRAPRQWVHGSALSMLLEHNLTESWELDIMNTNNQSGAWISMLAKNVFANTWLGANFTALQPAGIDPWYYTEYRVDWSRDRIDYYIGGHLNQSYTRKINGTLPSTPAPIRFKHWSAGNVYTTQGPPLHRSEADIGWTRLFFNSSLTTKEQHEAFDQRCLPSDACQMTDNSLRGSTAYPEEAIKKWKQANPRRKTPWVPVVIDIAFASLFTVLVAKTLYRRRSWAKLRQKVPVSSKKGLGSSATLTNADSDSESPRVTRSDSGSTRSTSPSASNPDLSGPPSFKSDLPRNTSYTSFVDGPPLYSGMHTPAPQYQTPGASQHASRMNSIDDMAIRPIHEAHSEERGIPATWNLQHSPRHSISSRNGPKNATRFYRENPETGRVSNPFLPRIDSGPSTPAPEAIPPAPITPGAGTLLSTNHSHGQPTTVLDSEASTVAPVDEKKVEAPIANVTPPTDNGGTQGKLAPAKRVDYLAGFIGISALLVTFNHFGLTFWAAVIIPSVLPHYKSETWARKTFATYFLDPLWIGPFLMISTRFLVSNYLRTGNLDNMASKVVVRPFRLLTPVASIALLIYFLMDSGALDWLQYLPSVTWSPWPFTAIPANPGVWLSGLVQLAFLIPNAAPNITYVYTTGVLWTIPVQLQGAWQTLLALIMIKEIKTPWKRFCVYAFCIVNHWYALSWGSYYYAGLLLADLDLTFKYTKWLHARPLVYYPLLSFMICVALGAFTIDMVVQWTGVNYATYEYGWHPDIQTGLTISQAGNAVYPDYFIPRLNALLATVSMQTIVEISPTLQKALSAKVLQWIFPHIFTIYLIHGFIFWSVGSWAMISFHSYGLPYWLCVLLVAIVCYGTLFASLPILSPAIEMVGKNFTASLWEHASQDPVPRRPTTFPFGPQLLNRDLNLAQSVRAAEEIGDGPRQSVEVDVKKTMEEADRVYMGEKGGGIGPTNLGKGDEKVDVRQF